MIPSISAVKALVPAIVNAAQEVYDNWVPEDGFDEDYGEGGICHDIADAIVGVLSDRGIDAYSVSQQIGEVHVYVVAKLQEGVYRIDIPPDTYERGYAYTWEKIPGVRFQPNDIVIDLIDKNPESLENYIEGIGFKQWLKKIECFMIRRKWPLLTDEGEELPTYQVSRKARGRHRR